MNKDKRIEHREPTPTTKKKILVSCGNQCAFPTCSDIIVDREHGVLVGKIAHIKARREGGPRFDYKQSEEENRSHLNLIALCAKHHDIVDFREDLYTADKLQSMKIDHEEKIEDSADRSWVRFPKHYVKIIKGLGSKPIYFWIDRNGRSQVYSARKLAIARTLFDIYNDIYKLGQLYELVENNPEAPARSLLQSYTRLDKEKIDLDSNTKWSVIAHLFVQMAEIPEITLGELIAYNVEGGDATHLLTNRAEILEKKIHNIKANL